LHVDCKVKSGIVIKDVDSVLETGCVLPEKYKSKGSKIQILDKTIYTERLIQGFRLHYKMSNHSLQRYTTHTTKSRRKSLSDKTIYSKLLMQGYDSGDMMWNDILQIYNTQSLSGMLVKSNILNFFIKCVLLNLYHKLLLINF
jgi:hypothetical protein